MSEDHPDWSETDWRESDSGRAMRRLLAEKGRDELIELLMYELKQRAELGQKSNMLDDIVRQQCRIRPDFCDDVVRWNGLPANGNRFGRIR